MTDDQSAQSLIGQNLGGRYTVVKLLGEGGMGAVYLGEQKLGQTLRKVAIKTLHPHLSHDPKILARFERECGTVAELQHPNTIQVFDFGKTEDGILYIVMEYAEGHSVAEDLEKNGPMDPPRVAKILAQVCGSLEEAHNHGIVHRDLKPDNVLLCERAGKKDWVEVLDFGIAKRGNEHDATEAKLTQQGTVLGTPPYMSPEQFSGKPVDARSDIYSLGVMAYEMLSGKMPFNGNTAWEWASAHMTAPPAPIESTPLGARVPQNMRNAISKALEKLPENRFQTVKDFIEAFADERVIAAVPGVDQAQNARGKTEIGAPMPMGAGFGAAPPAVVTGANPGFGAAPPQGGGGGYGPPGGGFGPTPSSGNQAFATPQTRTQHEEEGGGKRGLIIGAIAVLSVGVIGTVLVASGVFKSKTPDDPSLGITTPTSTIPTSTPVPGDTGGTAATTDTSQPTSTGALPTIATGAHTTTPPSTGTTKPTSTPTTNPTTPPPPSAHPTTTTPTTPTTPPTQPPPPATSKPAVNAQACADAARFCHNPSNGKINAITQKCESNKAACIASGGSVP
ncbi:MAG TPA: serine/threonine-protein kinase [Polyangiaceae bacterium]